jgi:aldehyde:ferredoxin oxidoreductase
MVELLQAVTGWDVSLDEIQAAGQRCITLSRVFNLREGLTAADDTLPRRFFAPFQKGEARRAQPLDEDAFAWAKGFYYETMGWDGETGVPSLEETERLDVGWAAEHLG